MNGTEAILSWNFSSSHNTSVTFSFWFL